MIKQELTEFAVGVFIFVVWILSTALVLKLLLWIVGA